MTSSGDFQSDGREPNTKTGSQVWLPDRWPKLAKIPRSGHVSKAPRCENEPRQPASREAFDRCRRTTKGNPMSEKNKKLYREYVDLFDRQDFAAAQKMYTSDYRVSSMPGAPGPLSATEHVEMGRIFYKAFPDLVHVVEDQVAEGDKVVTRLTVRGTHKADLQGIAPTGKQVTFPEICVARISNGKIAEEWVSFDLGGFMKQLGAG